MLALEYYALNITPDTPQEDKAWHLDYILRVLCLIRPWVTKDAEYLIQRIKEANERPTSQATPATDRLTFSSRFNKWMQELPTDALLAEMTGYDTQRMRQLYCVEDYVTTQKLIKHYVEGLHQKNLMAYECALYGAGNSYKGDQPKDPNTKVWDANTKEGMAAMGQFGFGAIKDPLAFGIKLDI